MVKECMLPPQDWEEGKEGYVSFPLLFKAVQEVLTRAQRDNKRKLRASRLERNKQKCFYSQTTGSHM